MQMNYWPGGSLGALLILSVLSVFPVAAADDSDDLQGWELSVATYDKARIAEFDARISDNTYKKINSVIVIKDGRLLIERYYNGAERDETHNPRSVGKTFASAVFGIALADGHIKRTDQTLSEFYDLRDYDNYDEKKASITLQQFLNMSSGFDGFDFDMKSIGNEEYMYPTPNWVEWTLNLPMAKDRNPGDQWLYFTAGIVVLGDILNSSVPGGLEAYADKKLFEPIGIRNYQWQHTPQQVANTGGGIMLTPLGFAIFGQLYKNGGRWMGTQVVPANWVAASMKPRVKAVDDFEYSNLWWHGEYQVDGEAYAYAMCSGNGGNKIFVFKDQPLVIVVTASAYGQRYMHRQVDDLMKKYILPAVR